MSPTVEDCQWGEKWTSSFRSWSSMYFYWPKWQNDLAHRQMDSKNHSRWKRSLSSQSVQSSLIRLLHANQGSAHLFPKCPALHLQTVSCIIDIPLTLTPLSGSNTSKPFPMMVKDPSKHCNNKSHTAKTSCVSCVLRLEVGQSLGWRHRKLKTDLRYILHA